MKMLRWMLSGLLAGAVVLLAGCGADEPEEATPTEQAAMDESGVTDEAVSGEEESTTDAVVIDLNQPSSPAEYDAAFKQGNYVAATESVLRMSAHNVEGANSVNRMRELQEEVARAAANGDPQARRAAELLRRVGRMPAPSGP